MSDAPVSDAPVPESDAPVPAPHRGLDDVDPAQRRPGLPDRARTERSVAVTVADAARAFPSLTPATSSARPRAASRLNENTFQFWARQGA